MLSANFARSEFKCSCGECNCDTVDIELLDALQNLRHYIGQPIIITSAHRCATHNKNVGGSDNSYHLSGRAADIQVKDVSPEVIQSYLKNAYPDKYGIGCYDDFTHIDTRTGKGRWYG